MSAVPVFIYFSRLIFILLPLAQKPEYFRQLRVAADAAQRCAICRYGITFAVARRADICRKTVTAAVSLRLDIAAFPRPLTPSRDAAVRRRWPRCLFCDACSIIWPPVAPSAAPVPIKARLGAAIARFLAGAAKRGYWLAADFQQVCFFFLVDDRYMLRFYAYSGFYEGACVCSMPHPTAFYAHSR